MAIVSRTVLDPLSVGLLAGVLVWLLFDEGANALLGLTAPPWKFPASAHARAFANHVVYGAVLGVLIMLARAIG